MKPQYVIILDTDFVARKIASILKRPVRADDFMEYIFHLRQLPYVEDYDLLLVYLNDNNQKLEIEQALADQDPQQYEKRRESYKAKNGHFAKLIKTGTPTIAKKMEMRERAIRKHRYHSNQMSLEEFATDLDQKGIDMEVSLDMAALAMRDNVVNMMVVTKNADFIPAFRFVRMMGVRVILDTLGNKIHNELIENSDIVINSRKLFVIDA